VDSFRSNLRPAEAAVSARPVAGTSGHRAFGGLRLQLFGRSALTVRLEDGDRTARPIRPGFGTPSDSDTGSWSAEWQAIVGSTTTFTRYSRRENVDHSNAAGSYTQHDASGQVFVTVSRSVQFFGLAVVTQSEMVQGGGNTYWQAGGGAQAQVPRRNLWMRAEGTFSRNIDLLTDQFVPRESLTLGLHGQVARQTTIGLNVQIDRAPMSALDGNPWLTRSMLRLTHTMSTGAARVVTGLPAAEAAAGRARGTGSILGNVFADWNGNGTQDADENALEGIPVRITTLSAVTTSGNGQFSFLNVPVGVQDVALDTTALPIDFDPPADASVQVDLARGATRHVTFGLIPLGSITGRVLRDANGNGTADPGEETIDGAIVVLDGGMRSEQTRRGRFRFDAVRAGDHTVQLLLESVGEGAKATAPATWPAPLTREKNAVDVTFLVTIEKRPEIRRVFPSKSGATSSPPAAAPAARSTQAPSTTTAPPTRAPARRERVERRPSARSAPPPASASASYVVQVAALRDAARARALVDALKASGYPAYLVEPAPSDPKGLVRIRVGRFQTASEAEAVKARLQKQRPEKLWVTREPQ
jgi:cell division septation protein DedD